MCDWGRFSSMGTVLSIAVSPAYVVPWAWNRAGALGV